MLPPPARPSARTGRGTRRTMSVGMRTARMNLRIEPSVDEQIRRAAAEEGVSVSEFVAAAAKAAADRTLADRTQFTLEPAAWELFCELLDRPARDLPGLDAADAAWQKHFAAVPRDAA